MPDLTNAAIANAFEELGDLLELDGAIIHRIVAYRTAARTVREAPVSVADLAREGRVTELNGIGKTLEEKIGVLLETGTLPQIQKLRERFPPGLLAITRLPGLGPKKARRLHEELGIDSLEALRVAAESQRIRELRGFGAKAEASMLEALDAGLGEAPARRFVLHRALLLGEDLVDRLRQHPAAERVELAGSARRMADSVKDLDIVATATDPEALARHFAGLDLVESASTPSAAGVRAVLHTGMQVDLRIVAPAQWGNLLQHLTGGKMHNVVLREQAVRKGLHVSEYGVEDDATGETHTCATEEEVYALLGMDWIPPELREDRGEHEAALARTLPRLVTLADLRGDLHCHTVASDGVATVLEMAKAARERGHEYLAITDHSATHGFGNEVPPDELRRNIERCREADAQLEGIRVLAGSEVNVLPDGELDYDDDLLAELDWVVASVHTAFALEGAAMTRRMVRAIEHPLVDAIGHPTGRLIERRDPYAVDVAALIDAAARTGTFLEINGAPDRRDLHDVHARAAAEAGVLLVVDSDAHRPHTLAAQRWGIATARRAWLTAEAVANTRPWEELERLRPRNRQD